MLMELAIQEKTIFKNDSSQLAIIQQIANSDEMSVSKINAEAVLSILTWDIYSIIIPEESSNRMFSNYSTYSKKNHLAIIKNCSQSSNKRNNCTRLFKFNAGIYFVKIVDQNNQIKLGKFVVAR